jgi:O-antigen/teichoic acid export membrane protein
VGRLVFTVGLTVVGVVMLHRGALGKATADLIVAAAGFLIVAFMLLRRATLCVDWPMLRESLRYALPVLPHTLAVVVLQITDKFFLTNLKGLDDAGIYSVGFKFGSIMSIIVYSTNLSWQPFFMKTAAEKGDEAPPIFARMTTYWLMVMVFLAIGITLFSHEAVYLFTLSAPFRAAAPLVPIFVFAYLLYGLYLLAATQVFYAKRAVKVLPFITVAAGVLNIVLNAVMIPRWGILEPHGPPSAPMWSTSPWPPCWLRSTTPFPTSGNAWARWGCSPPPWWRLITACRRGRPRWPSPCRYVWRCC